MERARSGSDETMFKSKTNEYTRESDRKQLHLVMHQKVEIRYKIETVFSKIHDKGKGLHSLDEENTYP